MTAPPQSEPTTRMARVNGIELACHSWAEEVGGGHAPLLIAHATGFHARCYSAIAERFPNAHVDALDLRGHGRSSGGPIDHWRIMADDVVAFLDQEQRGGLIGVGHSMGAHLLLQAAVDRPGAFARLVLFDPVILAPVFYEAELPGFSPDQPHPAIRRKRDFASPEEMIERFADREPYSLFERRVFEDYCRHGLEPAADGGWTLACSPEMEASVYASSRSNRAILDAAEKLDIPALVVRAKTTSLKDFKGSPTWPGLADTMPRGRDLHRPDRTHFHPFEDPADAARIIAEFASG
ncbi:alpha/beta hydrolase [Erythrobacter sp.]|jgi:pimeloyl-ACP methyl ester carboxylesterase|uniref:alpha/beta hydrolase n=1 Tax=Erythrobacter sp. TaxID=1042 RepID=UPI002E9B8F53|nr:alpha/beta hydrolase [Erythrobacter sp.]